MVGVGWAPLALAQSSGSFPEPAAPPSSPAAPPASSFAPPAPAPAPTPPATAPTELMPPSATPAPAAPAAPYAPAWTTSPPPTLTLQNLPPLLPYKKGLPVPPGYRVVNRSASGLTIGGGLTFLASYAGALGLAASQKFENGTAYAALPLVGPWAAIGGRTFKCKAPVTTNTVQLSLIHI